MKQGSAGVFTGDFVEHTLKTGVNGEEKFVERYKVSYLKRIIVY
jgi:hypothetical protein